MPTDEKKFEVAINNNVTRLLLGLLTIVFVYLKLDDKIDWSWWWVLAPLWLPTLVMLTLALVLYTLAGILLGIDRALTARKKNRK